MNPIQCRACGAKYDLQYRFCTDCGMYHEISTSTIQSQINKLRSMSSVPDMVKIQAYNEFLDNFPEVDENLKDIESEIATLSRVMNKLNWDTRGAEYDHKVSKREYNKTQGLSGLLARGGKENKETRRQKYERDQEIHTALQVEQEAITNQIQELQAKHKAWLSINRDFKKIIGWRQNLLEDILDGSEVPGTQALEQEIKELEVRIREISHQIYLIQQSRKSLNKAKRAYEDSISDLSRSVEMMRFINIAEFMTSNDGVLDNIGMALHGRALNDSIESMQNRLKVLGKEHEGTADRLPDLRKRYIELLDQRKVKQKELNKIRLEFLEKSQISKSH